MGCFLFEKDFLVDKGMNVLCLGVSIAPALLLAVAAALSSWITKSWYCIVFVLFSGVNWLPLNDSSSLSLNSTGSDGRPAMSVPAACYY